MHTVENEGARIAYRRTGEGPAVLLIQGVGLEGRAWQPQVDALAQWFTVIDFDHRGIGGSTAGRAPLSIELMARDALAVMDQESIDAFHVVGHSMGGVVAQHLALDARERVLSLSFLCTFAAGRDALRLDWGTMWLGIRSRVGTRRGRNAAFLEMVAPTRALPSAEAASLESRLSQVFGRDLGDQPPIAMHQLRALGRYDAGERLAALRDVPTLVVSAELDRIAHAASGRALADAIPGARYVEVPGAGHALPAYCPEALNHGLLTHLIEAEERTEVMAWV